MVQESTDNLQRGTSRPSECTKTKSIPQTSDQLQQSIVQANFARDSAGLEL